MLTVMSYLAFPTLMWHLLNSQSTSDLGALNSLQLGTPDIACLLRA